MNPRQPSKNGAALVIVLGFLAVLTVLVFAFAAQMRTGRLAGRAYLSSAQTAHLLNTALVRAMEDIDLAVGNGYPAFYATNSMGNGPLLADGMDFGMEEDYFPAGNTAIWNGYAAALDRARWQTIEAGGEVVGRVGYIIVNTSGLLDANAVAGYSGKRLSRLSPAELSLSAELLPELSANPQRVNADGSATPAESPGTAFAYNRENAWRRFESLRDVAMLINYPGSATIPPLTGFCVHTLFPQSSSGGKIRLDEETSRSEFIETLKTCGLDKTEAEHAYENYRDYIDNDDIPSDLLGSSPEAVPMLNEIAITDFAFDQNALDGTNVEYRLSGTLALETWYPFADNHPGNTTLECRAGDPGRTGDALEIVEGAAFVNNHDYITVTVRYTNDVAKSFVLALAPSESGTVVLGNFKTVEYGFEFDDTVQLEQPFEDDSPPAPLQFRILLDRVEVIDAEPVDRVEDIALNLAPNLPEIHASCIDPRINSDFTDVEHWDIGATPTPNEANIIADWGEESEVEDKNNIRFHVRNAPMENAGELGFLSTGKPWQTIRLYGKNPSHPVLDHFTAGEAIWGEAARPGLINLNSPHSNVVATAFFNAPASMDGDGMRVAADQARVIGANLVALGRGRFSTNLSTVGLAVSNNVPNWRNWCDAHKDAVVANTYRLFGWRDTQYTLLLAAQSGHDLNADGAIGDDEVRSTRKAVAQIWRDPVSGKAACVFFGLSETLQTSIGSGETWGTRLRAFNPDL